VEIRDGVAVELVGGGAVEFEIAASATASAAALAQGLAVVAGLKDCEGVGLASTPPRA
jgi:hypothetical protein